jgi:hypothetical protein
MITPGSPDRYRHAPVEQAASLFPAIVAQAASLFPAIVVQAASLRAAFVPTCIPRVLPEWTVCTGCQPVLRAGESFGLVRIIHAGGNS